LLTLDPPLLGNDRDAVEATLAAKIFDLEPLPRRRAPRPPGAAEPLVAPAQGPGAQEWTPVRVAHTSVPRGWVQGLGVIAGLAFAVVLIVEVYLGVIKVGIGGGRLVLGLAIVIDAFSRALGTVAAERDGRRGLACAVRVGGHRSSPGARCCDVRIASTSTGPARRSCSLAAGALALLALFIGS
jgi:hypothetical protein